MLATAAIQRKDKRGEKHLLSSAVAARHLPAGRVSFGAGEALSARG